MKIRLLMDVLVGKEHGMTKGRVLEVIDGMTGSRRSPVRVQGDAEEVVTLHTREYKVVDDDTEVTKSSLPDVVLDDIKLSDTQSKGFDVGKVATMNPDVIRDEIGEEILSDVKNVIDPTDIITPLGHKEPVKIVMPTEIHEGFRKAHNIKIDGFPRLVPWGTYISQTGGAQVPRMLSLVKLTKESSLRMNFLNATFVFLGEIPNMPEHCIVQPVSHGKLIVGYHTKDFVELTEDET